MATHRKTVTTQFPASAASSSDTPSEYQHHTSNSTPSSSSNPMSASPKFPASTLLPTPAETLLLSIYPTTLFLGALFSALHPSTRAAKYLPDQQCYDPAHAPSYFARKDNVFNIFFVKIGWIWITLAFAGLIWAHGRAEQQYTPHSHARKHTDTLPNSTASTPPTTRRRLQALSRYLLTTLTWIFVTQWFFGPGIIDRFFRWTGGRCTELQHSQPLSLSADPDLGNAMSHAACKALGGSWRGGHDISGHVFLLILGSAMLGLETLPFVLNSWRAHASHRDSALPSPPAHEPAITTSSASVHTLTPTEATPISPAAPSSSPPHPSSFPLAINFSLAVAVLSWWMLFMTAAYFHTWIEKLSGSLVAFSALALVYFLPRAMPAWRGVVGLPGW